MRLRYLHLPRCGPLEDVAIVFGKEERIAKFLAGAGKERQGTLNFLVGVNGSGKSSILRALYQGFLSLQNQVLPPQPMTLAWDVGEEEHIKTTVFHFTNDREAVSFFAQQERIDPEWTKGDWRDWIHAMSRPDCQPEKIGRYVPGRDAVQDDALYAHLPKRLLAYTSGSPDLWLQLEQTEFTPDDALEGQYQPDDERPAGWDATKEWERERDAQLKIGLKGQSATEMAPLKEAFQRWLDQQKLERPEQTYLRISPEDLRLAGMIMAMIQCAKELAGKVSEVDLEALRRHFVHQRATNAAAEDARRVLNKLDWFFPTHLSLTYVEDADLLTARQTEELFILASLADEVIALPSGRKRAVISLGAIENLNLSESLKDVFTSGLPSGKVEDILKQRIDGSKTGAEAVLKALAEEDYDKSALPVFYRLREWIASGLLEQITFTVRRIEEPKSTETESDPVVVHFDHLSDGEQVLLGRMGLLFLLRGQDNSLLLLDEPETHFNDVWKREIVEMMDTALLNHTRTGVLLATHTSIALTDAFAAEVTVLDKTSEGTVARAANFPLFGADPGRVLLNVFGAQDATGFKASRQLREKLRRNDWSTDDIEIIELVLDAMGSGWPRAKLIDLLEELKDAASNT